MREDNRGQKQKIPITGSYSYVVSSCVCVRVCVFVYVCVFCVCIYV